jgi:hypothetical protein
VLVHQLWVCCAAVLLQVFVGGSVCYGYTTIPTYPSGQIGMMVCCKGEQLDVRQPRQPPPAAHPQQNVPPLRWVKCEGLKLPYDKSNAINLVGDQDGATLKSVISW